MAKWPMMPIGELIEPFSLGAVPKLQTSEYKSSGKFPIIDQGQALIGGWTDDERGLISSGLPVIVFGDHTRTFKYVDFPFVRGADGTQILKPKPEIDPLYFYYACRAIDLPSRGYNRHFKLLKEKEISFPPRPEQEGIAAVLRQVEAVCNLEDKQIVATKKLKLAAMKTLFRSGLRGEPQKETEVGPMPNSWHPRTILDLCEIWSGGTPPKSVSEYWSGPIPWVSGKDLKAPTLRDTVDHISEAAVKIGSRLAPAGAVLLLVRGMGLAKDLPVALISRPMAFNQDIKALVSRGEFKGSFIRSAIYACRERLLARIVPSAHGTMTLNLDDVETFKIPCPRDGVEAEKISDALDTIDGKIDLHKRKRAVLDELFKTLLYKLMSAKISVDDLNLSALVRAGRLEAAE